MNYSSQLYVIFCRKESKKNLDFFFVFCFLACSCKQETHSVFLFGKTVVLLRCDWI